VSALGPVACGIAVAGLLLALVAPPSVSGPPHPDAAALRAVLPSWSLARWELMRFLLVMAAVACAQAFGLWPLGLVAAIVPSIALRGRVRGDETAAAAMSLDVLRSTQAALKSGLPLAPALRLAIERSTPLARDPFERALRAFDLNSTFDGALRAVAGDARDRRVALALEALALVAAEQLPAARAAAVIGSVLDRLTFEERLLEEVRARTSGVRAQIVLLALLVPALSLYLVATMPGLAATLATPLGSRVLVPAALIFEVAGIIASRAIVRGLGT
jgi:Flp pilus assembly protein TadB